MNHGSMSDYMAHGFCFSWEPALVWLHVTSDIVTGLAYYVITAAMGYFAYKRRDVQFMWVFLLFALFIFACGTTHFFAAYTVYRPDYWPEGVVKACHRVYFYCCSYRIYSQNSASHTDAQPGKNGRRSTAAQCGTGPPVCPAPEHR